VLAFLDHLETERKNSVATRNARLAALHAFARLLATRYPELLEESQRILAVPIKRGPTRAVDYLEGNEISPMLDAVSRERLECARDRALLLTLFNTGARVQEVLDLRPGDLNLRSQPGFASVVRSQKSGSVHSGPRLSLRFALCWGVCPLPQLKRFQSF
jgi:integrase